MEKIICSLIFICLLSCSKDTNDDAVNCIDTPILQTLSAIDINDSSAQISGSFSFGACSNNTVSSKGFVYQTKVFPKIDDKVIEVTDEDAIVTISDLLFNTTYYVRTYATNGVGTYYGNEISFTTTTPERINFPDENFEQALINKGYDNILDGSVLTQNIINVSELNLEYSNIELYQGIEGFSNLEKLNFNNNNLRSLDVSQNAHLTDLSLDYNQVGSLNINENINLRKLSCAGSDLNVLDVSNNGQLEELLVGSGNLVSIDVTKNPLLYKLVVISNVLRSLDVTQNLELRQLAFSTWIEFEPIDLTNNINLEYLQCSYSYLDSIDLSANLNLKDLDASSTRFTSLDLSNNAKLESLRVDYNLHINTLNISNNNNTNLDLLWAQTCPNLLCIEVDDVNYAENNPNWRKDSHTLYSTNCN